jgi:polyisoprenyl-phosphate glycosyltransferase
MKVSIVVPCYNEEGNIEVLVAAVAKALAKGPEYELILVDDGSADKTLEHIKTIAAHHKEVKYISFSRNFGHQAALRAGLAHASGEAVISMDADLQHPPELLPTLIEKWQQGYDIVYTVRDDSKVKTSFFKKFTSKMFYKVLNNLSELNIEEGAADFRLLDRKVVDVINEVPENNLFLRGFINWAGFKVFAVDYVPAERFSGVSKYSLKKMLALASLGITQFSTKPLHLANSLGLLSALAGVVYAVYVVIERLVFDNTVSGWASVTICVLVLGGVQLIILGIIGEYLGRTFMQTKHRPEYIVREQTVRK